MELTEEDQRTLTEWRTRAQFHSARAAVLSATVSLDQQLDETVAVCIAPDGRARVALQAVLSRLRSEDRLALLEASLPEGLLDEQYPFLLPVSRKLYDVRNVVAHARDMEYLPVNHAAGPAVVFETYRRGKSARRTVSLSQMRWLANNAETVINDLVRIWAGATLAHPVERC